MRSQTSLRAAALAAAAVLGIPSAHAGDGSVRVQTRETGLFAAGAGQHAQFNVSNRGDAAVTIVPCIRVCAPVVTDDRVGGLDGVHLIACGPDSREIEVPAVQLGPHDDVVWVFNLDTLGLPRDARGRAHIGLEVHLSDPPEPNRNQRVRFGEVLHTIEVFDGATGNTSNYFGSSELVTRGGD
jgi:hypothetical protein